MSARRVSAFTSALLVIRYLLFATLLGGNISLILYTNRSMDIVFTDQESKSKLLTQHRYNIDRPQSFTIKTEGCTIPAMEPLNDNIEKYVKYPSELPNCYNSSLSLLANDNVKIWVTENRLKYDIKKNLNCCYQAFYRPKSIQDITSRTVDDRVEYGECKYFNDTIVAQDEFVKVTCSVESKELYKQYFAFTRKKSFVRHDKAEKRKNTHAYNVLILGIDGVSRLNFHRTMPKTLHLLKTKGAVEIMGYNVVGFDTISNLIPMLLGNKYSEIKNVCHPHKNATFDNCPFIWEWFKQAGYYTALAEDCSSLGTFNYLQVGFSNTPTDYYMHTFIDQAESGVGLEFDFNSYLCMKDKYFYKVLLDYVQDLTTTLKNSKLFGFFWEITMSHDYLNYPMVMDGDYVRFLNNLEASNYLNDTIVILVSDHGIRWGGIKSIKQGRLEQRLPILFMLTPPAFREKYPQAYNNLKQNSKRLTTPFDVHETLADLVDLKNINDDAITSRSKTNYSHGRSISLFLPVPENRTCKMADIDDEWCSCHRHVAMSSSSPLALEVSASLVSFLNEMLEEYPQCARLFVSVVIDITVSEASNNDINMHIAREWQEYGVVLKTLPGDGIFEATLRKESDMWTLVGTVSRLNLYGDQSNCVDNYQLKLYCYCKRNYR